MGYITLSGSAIYEYIVLRSRFITRAEPVTDEAQALAVLDEERKKYRDASHHCYAYILGENNGIMRHSDDGEPAGTAGMPILEALRTRNITNAILVVTRYFGGTLLGTGGLVRAYGHAASQGAEQAGLSEYIDCAFYRLEMDYTTYSRAERFISREAVDIRPDFTDKVFLELAVPTTTENDFLKRLTEATEGKVIYARTGAGHVPVPRIKMA